MKIVQTLFTKLIGFRMLRESITVLHFMTIVERKWGTYELIVVPYLAFRPYSTTKIFIFNVM